jgi:hypothetical protein
MEPARATSPELLPILAELQAREPIFHTPQFGSTRADYERLMDEAYWEVGASGRRYSREFILNLVTTRPPDPTESSWLTRDFQCREIAPENYLLTYTLQQGARVTRRSTLWRRAGGAWRILYHQGTLVGP